MRTPAGPDDVKVVIDSLSYTYRNRETGETVEALREVSLQIPENEFLVIVGQSGCGKSTLLKLVAGLLRPTSGRISVDGRQITRPGRDRGLVFQDYALLPWKTVRENVELGLKFRGLPRRERRHIAEEYIELVGLEGFADKHPHELSGGMSQRVAVARTLANSPSVMLMDEPFAAVDALTREGLQEQLTHIWETHRLTVLFVTHNVEEAVFLGDRVAVMSRRPGRIREIVPVEIPRQDREWSNLLHDERFNALRAQVNDLLKDAGDQPQGDDSSAGEAQSS